MKQRVVNAYTKRGGFGYIPSKWDKNLWKKSTADIYDYIDNRFRNTLDVVEYYSAMVFLYKHIPNQELLVEFHSSKQWAEVAKTYEHVDQTKALSSSGQKSARMDSTEGDCVEMQHTITFDGEI
jgi:hypothetical protein